MTKLFLFLGFTIVLFACSKEEWQSPGHDIVFEDLSESVDSRSVMYQSQSNTNSAEYFCLHSLNWVKYSNGDKVYYGIPIVEDNAYNPSADYLIADTIQEAVFERFGFCPNLGFYSHLFPYGSLPGYVSVSWGLCLWDVAEFENGIIDSISFRFEWGNNCTVNFTEVDMHTLAYCAVDDEFEIILDGENCESGELFESFRVGIWHPSDPLAELYIDRIKLANGNWFEEDLVFLSEGEESPQADSDFARGFKEAVCGQEEYSELNFTSWATFELATPTSANLMFCLGSILPEESVIDSFTVVAESRGWRGQSASYTFAVREYPYCLDAIYQAETSGCEE